MMRSVSLYNNPHFRITIWPDIPLPIPPYQRREHYRLDASGVALVGTGAIIDVHERHGEIYLRLYDLDLGNSKTVLAFAQRYGVLSNPQWGVVDIGLPALPPSSSLKPTLETIIRRDPELRAARKMKRANGTKAPFTITHLTEFSAAARYIRDLTTAWRLVSNDPNLEPQRATWELSTSTERPTQLEALDRLTRGLTRSVEAFQPFLRPANDQTTLLADHRLTTQVPSSRGAILHQGTAGARDTTLFEICALELLNHIAGRDAYRVCQNDKCGRVFVRQWGRSEHGQSKRQGVMYCTHSCAQAQTQRMYRRRKKATRNKNA